MRSSPALRALLASFVIAHAGMPGGSPSAHAEPIAIDAADGDQGATVADKPAPDIAGASDEVPDGDEVRANDDVSKGDGERRTPRSRRKPEHEPSSPPDAHAEAYPALRLAAIENDAEDWEHEIKEAIRPIYDELAAAGIVDALYGVRDTLGQVSAGVSAALDGTANGATPTLGEAGERPLRPDYADTLYPGKSPEQIENEKLLTALLIEKWVAAIKPWFFALLALYVLWQTIRLGFVISRRYARHTWKHGAGKTRGRRAASHRTPGRR